MVDQEVISKKELLELTGISYGQLYRWKRKNIIPESWFIKKSSFTGQETYFPKEKILERLEKIIEMKDTHSLDELSDFFSPNPSEVKVTRTKLLDNQLISEETFKTWNKIFPLTETFKFREILNMYILDQIAKKKRLTEEECVDVLTFLNKYDLPGELIGVRKQNTLVWILIKNKLDLAIEENANIEIEVNILEHINDLKIKISELNF